MMGGGIPATQQQVQGDLPSWLPTCNTCKQKARTPDRFHPHGAILLWPKKGLRKETGKRTREEGNECGCCNGTRVRNFGGVPQKDLNSVLDESEECRSKWEEKRTEICCPVDDGKKRKYEKCDLNSYRKEENFTSIFQKGKAEPVTDFLVSQGFDVKQLGDEAKQIQFVQNELGLTVHDDNGVSVVVTLTGEREVHVGTTHSAAKMKVHHHESQAAASASHAKYKNDMDNMAKTFVSQGLVQDKIDEARSKLVATEVMSEGVVAPRAGEEGTSEAEEKDIDMFSGSGFRQVVEQQNRGNGNGNGSSIPNQHSDAPVREDIPAPRVDRNPRQSGRDKLASSQVAKAQTLFSQKQSQFSDAALWKGGFKRRQVQTAAKQLDDAAQKLVVVEDCAELVSQITDFADGMVRRFDVLGALRKEPVTHANEISSDAASVIESLSPHLVAQCLVHVITSLLKDLEQEASTRIPACMNVIAITPDSPGFCLKHFVMATLSANVANPDSAMKSADSLQMQLFYMMLDRIFRIKSVEKTKECLSLLPALDLGIDLASIPAEFNPRLPTTAPGIEGAAKYYRQLAFDSQVARLVVTEWEAADARTKLVAKSVTENKAKCSEKLLQYFKAGAGKTWWHQMERAGASAVPPATPVAEAKAALKDLEDFKGVGDAEALLHLCFLQQLVDPLVSALTLSHCHLFGSGADAEEVAKELNAKVSLMQDALQKHGAAAVSEIANCMTKDGISRTPAKWLEQPGTFKNLCKLLSSYKVGDWTAISEPAADRIAHAIMESVKMLVAVTSVDQDLTVEKFVEASKSVRRFQSSRSFAIVGETTKQITGSGPNCLADIDIAAAALASLGDSPSLWCNKLINDGRKDELLDLSTSARSGLGSSVEGMLRAAQILRDFESPEDKKPSMFYDVPWLERSILKSGVQAFHDLRSSPLDHVPQIEGALKVLRQNLMGTFVETTGRLDKMRRDLQVFYGTAYAAQKALVGGTSNSDMKAVLMADENKATCESAVKGLQTLIELESTCAFLLSWKADLEKDPEISQSNVFAKLELASKAEPTSHQLSVALYSYMAGDQMANCANDASEAFSDLQAFRSYATTVLKVLKKDVPTEVVNRFDKFCKEIQQKVKESNKNKKDKEKGTAGKEENGATEKSEAAEPASASSAKTTKRKPAAEKSAAKKAAKK